MIARSTGAKEEERSAIGLWIAHRFMLLRYISDFQKVDVAGVIATVLLQFVLRVGT